MEQERMKRRREGNEESEKKKAKKREGEKEKNERLWESGVFDFPWLEDGFMSMSEDYIKTLGFEDNFWSLLEQEEDAAATATITIDSNLMAHNLIIPEDNKLEDLTLTFESDMLELEAEIWSSVLNQPL